MQGETIWCQDVDVDRNRDISVDEKLLVSSVRGLTLLPHDILDQKGERNFAGLLQINSVLGFKRVFFISNPIEGIAQLRFVQLAYLFMFVFIVVGEFLGILSFQSHPLGCSDSNHSSSFSRLRFTSLESTDGRTGASISTPGISDFGLLFHAVGGARPIPMPDIVLDSWTNGSSTHVTLDGPKIPSCPAAWYFSTSTSSNETEADHPVKFVLEGSTDGEDWYFIGSSDHLSARARYTDFRYADPELLKVDPRPLRGGPPSGKGVRVEMSLIVDWDVYITYDGIMLFFAVGIVIVLFSAIVFKDGRIRVATISSISFFSCSVFVTISSIHMMFTGIIEEGILWSLACIVGFCTAYAYSYLQTWFDMWYTLSGVCFFVIFSLAHFTVNRLSFGWSFVFFPGYIMIPLMVMTLGMFFTFSHSLMLLRGLKLVMDDKNRYLKEWNNLLLDPTSWDELDRLKRTIEVFSEGRKSCKPCQLHRRVASRMAQAENVKGGSFSLRKSLQVLSRLSLQMLWQKSARLKIVEAVRLKTGKEVPEQSFGFLVEQHEAGVVFSDVGQVARNNPYWALAPYLIQTGSQSSGQEFTDGSSSGFDEKPSDFTKQGSVKSLVKGKAFLPRSADPRSPVRSLSQVYLQATIVSPSLHQIAYEYGLLYNGMFEVKRQALEMRPSSPMTPRDKNEEYSVPRAGNEKYKRASDLPFDAFKWAKVKSVGRCLDKIEIAYEADTSLLLDVARTTIVFSQVSDLVDCLEALCRDPNIDIVRIVNGMDPEKSEEPLQAGLKFVKVNLAIHTERMRMFGVETHICELILILHSQIILRSKSSWKRYIFLRNVRNQRSNFITNFFILERRKARSARVRPMREVAKSTDSPRISVLPDLPSPSALQQPVLPPRASPTAARPLTDGKKGSDEDEIPTPDTRIEIFGIGNQAADAESKEAKEGVEEENLCNHLPDDAESDPPVSVRATGAMLMEDVQRDTGKVYGPVEKSSRPGALQRDGAIARLHRDDAGVCSLDSRRWEKASNTLEMADRHLNVDLAADFAHATESANVESAKTPSAVSPPGIYTYAVEKSNVSASDMVKNCLSGPSMLSLLLHQTRLNSLGWGGVLSHTYHVCLDQGMHNTTFTSILAMARPLTIGSMIPMLQAIFFIMACGYLVELAVCARGLHAGIQNQIPFVGHRYRFTAISNRIGNDATSPGVKEFGILDDMGLPKSLFDMNSAANHTTMERVEYGTSIYLSLFHDELNGEASTTDIHSARGFYLVTSEGEAAENDSTSFFISVSSDRPGAMGLNSTELESLTWTRVSTGAWITTLVASFEIQHVPILKPSALPEQRGAFFILDTEAIDWIWPYQTILGSAIKASSYLLFILFGQMHKPKYARGTLILSQSAVIILEIVVFSFTSENYKSFQLYAVLPLLLFDIMFFIGSVYETYIFHFWIIAGVTYITAFYAVGYSYGITSIDEDGLLPVYMPNRIVCYFVLATSLITQILRIRAQTDSWQMIEADQTRYDKIWKEITLTEDGRSCIEHLSRVVQMTGLADNIKLVQCNRRMQRRSHASSHRSRNGSSLSDIQHPIFNGMQTISVPGLCDDHSHITCVDQLFCQAGIVQALLKEIVQAWADSSRGMFQLMSNETGPASEMSEKPTRVKPEFVRWSDAKGTLQEQRIKWPPLKTHERCLEKLLRVYMDDVSRLVDIVRYQIVFEDLSDLTMCLGQIAIDPHVRIERIKNRMHPLYKSRLTAGYRDVNINIKCLHPAAVALGVDGHVCEIQLVLKSIAELRSSEGHALYVQFRNKRGM